MESQDLRDTFFDRFLLQAKLISQLVTFWWTYSEEDEEDDNNDQDKTKAANILGQCFFPGFSEVDPFIAPPKLRYLFSADPRQHLQDINNGSPTDSFGNTDENPLGLHVSTLITVFGSDRINNQEKYLSPIFTSTELGLDKDKNNSPYYEFRIDNSGTKFGRLTDPELVPTDENLTIKYIYTIPIPPRHLDPHYPKHKRIYEKWISDQENTYPPSMHIPFTT
ncbi:MAG: hypothetical protein KME46_08610 [Brasilonema angustatum HA4187-MV1]|jgi:hypothetical protein|nr:hypothetical protein [Brasilonema angustatum HA4187-MV1]